MSLIKSEAFKISLLIIFVLQQFHGEGLPRSEKTSTTDLEAYKKGELVWLRSGMIGVLSA